MKRLVFISACCLVSAAAQAQITLEKKQPGIVDAFKLADGTLKYAGTYDDGPIMLYNANHSLYKQVPISVPAGFFINNVEYVSDRLFNANANVELVVNLFGGAGETQMRIIDETGASVMQVDSAAYPRIYNTTQGTKMLVQYYLGFPRYTRIYSPPGSYTPLRTAAKTDVATGNPYPNPAQERISLPYSVPPGEVATLDVLDLAGRVVKSYQVTAAFSHLLLDARELPGGAYGYRVTAVAGTTTGRKFVVGR